MAKECGPMESKETPEMEAKSHSKGFLNKAAKLGHGKKGESKKEMKKEHKKKV